MLMDLSLILDDNLPLTTTGASTNYIDTIGAAGGQAQISGVNTIQGGYDAYEQVWWEVLVRTTMAGGTSVDFSLWTGSSVAQVSNGASLPTGTKVADTGVVLTAKLISSAGKASAAYEYTVRLPQGMQRYIGGYYTVVGIFTSGNITSCLVPDQDINLT